ncbi:MAG TPA: hypothetical protein VFZ53_21580, partial [Polyangiaceae bacterium]
RLAEDARRLGAEANDGTAETLFRLNREGLLRAAERHEELIAWQPALRQAFEGYRFASAWQPLASGLAHAHREDAAQAAQYLGLLPLRMPDNLYSLFFHAEVTAIAGGDALVADVYERLCRVPDDYVMLGMSYFSWEGPRSRLLALLLARLGRFDEASAAFEDAMKRCAALEAVPYLARTEYEYGRLLGARNVPEHRERAVSLLRSAAQRAMTLGMPGLIHLAERRLAELPGAPRSGAPDGPLANDVRESAVLELSRDGEFFALSFEGATLRLRDSLGLRYLARLVQSAGTDVHVLDLVRERGTSDASDLADAGDAGELLDDEARARYEKRLLDLREAESEADAFGDRAKAARAREEIAFLAQELSRAVGLGGRKRRAGAAVERARSAVQRRIRHALERIAAQAPALGEFLSKSVSTGINCSFRPTQR